MFKQCIYVTVLRKFGGGEGQKLRQRKIAYFTRESKTPNKYPIRITTKPNRCEAGKEVREKRIVRGARTRQVYRSIGDYRWNREARGSQMPTLSLFRARRRYVVLIQGSVAVQFLVLVQGSVYCTSLTIQGLGVPCYRSYTENGTAKVLGHHS